MVNDRGHIGPAVTPHWWDLFRQIAMFGLAIFCIIYGATTPGHDVPLLVTGLILMGIIPIERFLDRWRRGGLVGPEGDAPPASPSPWPKAPSRRSSVNDEPEAS
jgi:hypothetical protein